MSEKRFREVIENAQSDKSEPFCTEALTQVARAQGLQHRFDEAHETLRTVEKLTNGETSRARIRYLLETGRILNTSGDPAASEAYFEQALELANRMQEDYLAVDAAHMLGIVTSPEDQIRWNLEAIRMAEASKDPLTRKWQCSLYNNLGWTYYMETQYSEALELFEKANAYYVEHGTQDEMYHAAFMIARTYRSLKRFDDALSMLRQFERTHADDGYLHEELGLCLFAMKRHTESRPYFRRAYEILSQVPEMVKYSSDVLENLERMGNSNRPV